MQNSNAFALAILMQMLPLHKAPPSILPEFNKKFKNYQQYWYF